MIKCNAASIVNGIVTHHHPLSTAISTQVKFNEAHSIGVLFTTGDSFFTLVTGMLIGICKAHSRMTK